MKASRHNHAFVFTISVFFLWIMTVGFFWYAAQTGMYATDPVFASREREESRNSSADRSSPSRFGGSLNISPSITAVQAAPSGNGSNQILITAGILDYEANAVQVKVGYVLGRVCPDIQHALKATIVSSTITATFGQASTTIDSLAPYQIQQISTEQGNNTISFLWNVGNDIALYDGEVCLTLVANDGSLDGRQVHTLVTIDTVPPTPPGPLTNESVDMTGLTLGFGKEANDAHFAGYRIVVVTASSTDQATYTLTGSDDPDLLDVYYNHTLSTRITGLATSSLHAIEIFAYDAFGNATPSGGGFTVFTLADTPGIPQEAKIDPTSVHLILDPATNPVNTEFAICGSIGLLPCAEDTYVQSDFTLGSTTTWKTYTAWGGKDGFTVTGLSPRLPYTFLVKARNGALKETAFSPFPKKSQSIPLADSAEEQGTEKTTPQSPFGVTEVIFSQKLLAQLGASQEAFVPTAFFKATKNNTPILYTNNLEITLEIDPTIADLVVLSESIDHPSGDFAGKKFIELNGRVTWRLKSGDGKKCVNAKFRDSTSGEMFTSYVCVIVDTVPPGPPTLSTVKIEREIVDREIVTRPSITGSAEPFSLITIGLQKNTIGLKYPIRIASLFLPSLHLAANHESQFTVEAEEHGTWSFQFPDGISPGTYSLAIAATDPAGNTSEGTAQVLTIPGAEQNPPQNEEKPISKPEIPKPKQEEQEALKVVTAEEILPNPTSTILLSSTTIPSREENIQIQEENTLFETVAAVPETVIEPLATAREAIQEVVGIKEVQTINQSVVAPVTVAAAVANVAVGFTFPQVLVYLQYLFGQPLTLLRIRKQKSWGVVYHAFTKRPVDLAAIRLIDEKTGAVVQSRVTDAAGRYFFIVEPGFYRLEVQKQGFTGFSTFLKNKSEDAKFINLYHGAAFTISQDKTTIQYNIPLDPTDEAATTGQILRDHSKHVLQRTLSIVGVIVAFISFAISPTPLMAVFLALHLLFYGIFYRLAYRYKPTSYGVIVDKNKKKPLRNVVVRVFDVAYDKLVQSAVTDIHGRYAVLVGPSQYYVTYEKAGYEKKQSDTFDFGSEKTGGLGGIIAHSEELVRVPLLRGLMAKK